MYTLETPLIAIKGIGVSRRAALETLGITTVADVLLRTPLRYEDRSLITTIADAPRNQLVTIRVTVKSFHQRYQGRKSTQTAVLTDESGSISASWFYQPYLKEKLVKGSTWLVSGKINDRGWLTQAVVEADSDDTLHTGRLVPIYSSVETVKAGSWRRLLKTIIDNLKLDDPLQELAPPEMQLLSLQNAFRSLHFPTTAPDALAAGRRLALEELVVLIKRSHINQAEWAKLPAAASIPPLSTAAQAKALNNLPFQLTHSQQAALAEISQNLSATTAMNRLLIGDVGSGKTVVAGLAALQVWQAGHTAALVAPTVILAEQHCATLKKLFPQLPIQLLTSKTILKPEHTNQPGVWIGTHAVLHRLSLLQPRFIIIDEQHRFGVKQRALLTGHGHHTPHLLTMTATPIPRSLMLSIFSHLAVSQLTDLPPGRIPTKTWLVPGHKRPQSLTWIQDQIQNGAGNCQVLWVCPFIDPSNHEALENVAAASDFFESLQKNFVGTPVRLGLLHGKQPKNTQRAVIDQMKNHQLDVLVTTPIVEVGVDLPAASIMVIEAAERFGLASLHQMRGRVGRAGQQGYCLLFTTQPNSSAQPRLQKFTGISNGFELAELDLENRGAGDIFGTMQHGFDQLQFATWTDFEAISQARILFERISDKNSWHSLLETKIDTESKLPLAN